MRRTASKQRQANNLIDPQNNFDRLKYIPRICNAWRNTMGTCELPQVSPRSDCSTRGGEIKRPVNSSAQRWADTATEEFASKRPRGEKLDEKESLVADTQHHNKSSRQPFRAGFGNRRRVPTKRKCSDNYWSFLSTVAFGSQDLVSRLPGMHFYQCALWDVKCQQFADCIQAPFSVEPNLSAPPESHWKKQNVT